MSTTVEKLVRMANQIAVEFANQRAGDAATATYEHIRHFWDPRMRAQIIAHLAAGEADLNDIARAAVMRLDGE